jgi:hypothetical protein
VSTACSPTPCLSVRNDNPRALFICCLNSLSASRSASGSVKFISILSCFLRFILCRSSCSSEAMGLPPGPELPELRCSHQRINRNCVARARGGERAGNASEAQLECSSPEAARRKRRRSPGARSTRNTPSTGLTRRY